MTMDPYRDWLNDWVDGGLEPGRRAELEAHFKGCASCRAEAEDLARVKKAAAALERRDPPATVWPQIAAAIRTGAVARPGGRAREPFRFSAKQWRQALLPLAAVFLLAAAAGLLRVTLDGLSRSPAAPPASVAGASDSLVEKNYQGAIEDLEKMVERDHSLFDPAVAQALQSSLATIDQAIGESRAAVDAQPDDELAKESLLDAFRRKLLLLENTIVLLNDIRKGEVDPDTLRQIQDIQGKKGASKS